MRPTRSRDEIAWALAAALALATGHTAAAGEPEPDRTQGGRYPAHWWQPVAESETAWWEIPPQAA